jgi:lysophospholipase L1-like esterase
VSAPTTARAPLLASARGACLLVLLAAACGGGGGPTAPSPPPTAAPGFTVQAVVFYDENGNGILDAQEHVRLPNVEVDVAGQSGRSQASSGQTQVNGVPAGSYTATMRGDTLPPFYRPEAPAPVTVPTAPGTVLQLGVTLPIGANLPNIYMAFGDSITAGDTVSQAQAWPTVLQGLLQRELGDGVVRNRGASGTNSFEALERLQRNLAGNEPAYTLIVYGTNDWNAPECQDDPHCPTVENLRTVVRRVKAFQSLPFLATLPPVNPALTPAGRNDWTSAINDQIRVVASQEGAFLVDLEKALRAQGDLTRLFNDHVHPNPTGHQIIANTFFEAIAHGRSVP